MGEVYRPEDVVHGRVKKVHDLIPKTITKPATKTSLEEMSKNIELMRLEIARIKIALKAHGIAVE